MLATHPNRVERTKVLAERAVGRTGQQRRAEYQTRLAPLHATLLADELQRGRLDEALVLFDRLMAAAVADAATEPGTRAELLFFRGEARRLRAKPGDAELALMDSKRRWPPAWSRRRRTAPWANCTAAPAGLTPRAAASSVTWNLHPRPPMPGWFVKP